MTVPSKDPAYRRERYIPRGPVINREREEAALREHRAALQRRRLERIVTRARSAGLR